MVNKSRVGSTKNPIKTIQEHDKLSTLGLIDYARPLLQKHIKTKVDEGEEVYFDFGNKPSAQTSGLFLKNLISNPFLSTLELKIGVALFDLLSYSEGEIFITTTRKIVLHEGDSDDSTFFTGQGESIDWRDFNEIPLQKILSDNYKINVTTDEMNKRLKRLHDFHYISVTGITYDNVYSKQRTSTPKGNKRQSYLKLIQLYEGMSEKSLVGKWKEKPPRKKRDSHLNAKK